MDGMQLYKYVLGSFEEVSDCFTVFEEIAQGFSGIDDEAFRAVQNKRLADEVYQLLYRLL